MAVLAKYRRGGGAGPRQSGYDRSKFVKINNVAGAVNSSGGNGGGSDSGNPFQPGPTTTTNKYKYVAPGLQRPQQQWTADEELENGGNK